MLLKEIYKLPEKTILSVYKHRKAGYGPYDVAKKIKDEGLGIYTPTTLNRHADSEENVKKYTETGEYHPKVEKSDRSRLKDDDLDKAFSLRKQGISDNKIAARFGIHKNVLRSNLERNRDHPSYVPNQKLTQGSPNPSDLVSSVLSMHGTINKETGQSHTFSSIAAEHGITRSKVAGIISRNKGSNKMESLNTKIKNVLKESWMKKRSETLKKVRKSKGEESERMVPKEDTREVFRNTVMKHMDDLHTKFLNDENLHPEVRQEIESHIKRLGQTLSKF